MSLMEIFELMIIILLIVECYLIYCGILQAETHHQERMNDDSHCG